MKIPTVTTGQNVGRTTLKGVRATAQDFASPIVPALAKLGQGLQEQAVKEFHTANLAAVQDAESQLYEWENNAFYGDDGLYNKKGRDALGASDSLMKDFDEQSTKIMGTLTNDSQREAFRKSLLNRKTDILRTSSRYQFNELQSYKKEKNDAYLLNSQIAAANNYLDTQRVNDEIKRQTDAIRATALVSGQSPELTKVQVDSAVSATHSSVVTRFLSNKDYSGARKYFDRNKDLILPEKRDQLKSMVENGNQVEVTQTATDLIMGMDLTEKDALSYARKNYTGKERDAIVQRVKIRYGELDQDKIFNDIQASSTAYNQILNGQDIDVVHASNLTPEVQQSLDTYKLSLATGEPIVTVPADKARLDFMAKDNPTEFMKTNLYRYRGTLSDSDFNSYNKMQSKMISDAKQAAKQGKPFYPKSDFYNPKTYTAKVAKEFNIYNPELKTQTPEYQKYYTDFADHVDQSLVNAQALKGAALSWAEEKAIIDKEAAFWKTTVSKEVTAWFDESDILVGTLTEDDLKNGSYYVDVNGMPKDVSILLTEYLIRNNIPPTEENIMYAFQQDKYK